MNSKLFYCPARDGVAKRRRLKLVADVGAANEARLNGNNGSATNTDDTEVAHFFERLGEGIIGGGPDIPWGDETSAADDANAFNSSLRKARLETQIRGNTVSYPPGYSMDANGRTRLNGVDVTVTPGKPITGFTTNAPSVPQNWRRNQTYGTEVRPPTNSSSKGLVRDGVRADISTTEGSDATDFINNFLAKKPSGKRHGVIFGTPAPEYIDESVSLSQPTPRKVVGGSLAPVYLDEPQITLNSGGGVNKARLNGNNGSATNTDDVNKIKSKEKKVVKQIRAMALKKFRRGMVPTTGTSSVRWSHKELVRDLNGASAFTNIEIPVNFRNAELFPFARRLADNFDRYKIHGLTVHYETTSSDTVSTTTNAIGTVYLALAYDPDDTAPTTEEEVTTIDKWVSAKPSLDFSLSMTSNLHKLYFLRGGDGSTSSDPRLEDPAVLQISVIGCPFTTQIGKVWVSYDVEFFNPRLTSLPSKGLYSLTHCLNCVTASPFGAAESDRTLATSSDFAPDVTNASGSTIFTFPVKGRFLVYVNFDAGTSCTLSGSVPAVYGQATFANVLINAADGSRGNNVWGSGAADAGYAFCVDVPNTSSGFRIYDPTLVSAGTNAADVLLMGVSADIDVDVIKGMTSRMMKLRADLRALESSLKEVTLDKLMTYERSFKARLKVEQEDDSDDGPVLVPLSKKTYSSSSSSRAK